MPAVPAQVAWRSPPQQTKGTCSPLLSLQREGSRQ